MLQMATKKPAPCLSMDNVLFTCFISILMPTGALASSESSNLARAIDEVTIISINIIIANFDL